MVVIFFAFVAVLALCGYVQLLVVIGATRRALIELRASSWPAPRGKAEAAWRERVIVLIATPEAAAKIAGEPIALEEAFDRGKSPTEFANWYNR